ncbi:hypothetical protein PHET_10216 [Paragonimus heterotremus]|uniref:Uncharacterized protein n=1 Tax=Paragonimus heterotremus TaxID=100268 RepID=A0A8J4WEF2_9TREM|nr:hypothetical protein PHET_10216 [Paragonimus heterotremus]
MGCNPSKSLVHSVRRVNAGNSITEVDNMDTDGKTYVVFDIKLDNCATSGDCEENKKANPKLEIKKPVRLAPLSNPPILTSELIEEKLRKAEEKRKQLLATRRLSCQKAKQSPVLMMQGRGIQTRSDNTETNDKSPWSLNWSGDEVITDEQLDALLLSELEREESSADNPNIPIFRG